MKKTFYLLLILMISQNLIAQNSPFITRWNLATAGSGTTQLSFGVATTGNVNYSWQIVTAGVAFGATTSGTFTGTTANITGLPANATIELSISPTNFQRININFGTDRSRLTSIQQWGDVAWTSMETAFSGCNNMQLNATDVPNTTAVTNMRSMFRACSSFNQALPNFNTAAVTNMGLMFFGCSSFNQPLPGNFNTALVTNMSYMFAGCSSFNRALPGSFTTAAVTDMSFMFFGCSSFNQALTNFNTAAVTNMSSMFEGSSSFNQPLTNFNTAAVTDMRFMFNNATAFNQSLAAWGTQLNAGVLLTNFLDNCGMSVANYDATLTGFNQSSVTGRSMGAVGRQYCASATDRANLVKLIANGGKGWTITGDTPTNACNFVTRWNLATAGSAVSGGITQLSFGVATSGTVNYTWQTVPAAINGSGTFTGTTATIPNLPANATIELSISPTNFRQININNGTDRSRLTSIQQWGNVAWTGMESAFSGCNNMVLNATDVPNTAAVTNMSFMFNGCSSFNQALPNFNTAAVTNMSYMFNGCTSFNQALPNFNTAAVTNMSYMFYGCTSFNQALPNFNTAAVTNMSFMFFGCSSFNQALNNFNTEKVTDMSFMFFGCSSFNQALPNFNTAAVTNMFFMFNGCSSFNQALPNFNTAAVTNMSSMFNGCSSFNQPLPNFNTAAVTDMSSMFNGCSSFNQSLPNFNTAAVTNMSAMFAGCSSFNQPLPGSFNTAAVTNMSYMFFGCSSFNQPLPGSFNTAAVKNMSYMFFGCSSFNQALTNFNTTAVTNMSSMFEGSSSFNQPLNNFNTAAVTNMSAMFSNATAFNQSLAAWGTKLIAFVSLDNFLDNCGMSVANYDATLTGFNQGTVTSRSMGAVGLRYCGSAADRANLVKSTIIGGKGWTITGDLELCNSAGEINIKGNNVSIPDGDTTPSTGDLTNFGAVAVSSGAVVRTFTIENTGAQALLLTGLATQRVVVSGANAIDFTVNAQPASPVAATNGTATFQVTFDPSAGGLRTATIIISNSDADESPYTFDIQGIGCGAALLPIRNNITSGTGVYSATVITAANQITNANIEYRATQSVTLLPGFKAEGTVFRAQIGTGCN